ncbi:MAG: T9SS type A sorting domain-containing protein [Melioribacteraceae bacterium]
MKRIWLHLVIQFTFILFIYGGVIAQIDIQTSVQSSAGGIVQGGAFVLNSTIGQPSPNSILTGGEFNVSSGFIFKLFFDTTNTDTQAPVIKHTPVLLVETNKTITISANITDDKQVSNAQLFYRKIGEVNFILINMTANESVYSADIPSSEVTTEGLEYYLTAVDTSGNDIREPTSGVFSVQVSTQDVEPPTITHNPALFVEINQTITITANITDNEQVSNAQLFYRKGGEIIFKSLDMSASGNTYSGDIPNNEVTLRGLEYYITAADSLSNKKREPSTGVIILPVRVNGEGLVKETAQPSGSVQTAYRLISFPLDIENKNSESIFDDDLGSYDKTKWRLFEMGNEQSYKENTSTLKIKTGIAYWLIVKDADKKIDTGPAKSIKTNEPFAIPLNAGWTFIGNPFNYPIPLSNLSLANSQNFTIESFSGSWSPFTESLKPFEGYAVHSENITELLVNPAITSSSLSKKAKNEMTKSLWEINISASCQNAVDYNNIVALVSGSSKDWDNQDRPEPPVIGEYISLYFPHNDWDKISKTYSKDARPEFEEGEVWNFEVKTNIEDIVKLSFENIKDVPEEYAIMLIDKKNQTVKELKKSQEYSFISSNTVRKLQLVIGTNEFVNNEIAEVLAVPTDYQLYQNYPNPFNPTTTIKYSIPNVEKHTKSFSNVTLKVYDVIGKEVATLVNQKQTAGNYEVSFDATELTSGVYFYKITTDEFNQVHKMLVLK